MLPTEVSKLFWKGYPLIRKGKKRNNHRSVLVFIHGFDKSFQESIQTGADLAHLYSSDDQYLIPFVFSWPSAGEFGNIQYIDDREVAKSSGCAGARLRVSFLSYLVNFRQKDFPCLSSAFLVTHSMGVYVLSHAAQNLKKILGPLSPILDATILTAPDVDVLDNSDKLLSIHNLTKEFVVYVNKNDKALGAAGNLFVESNNVQDGCQFRARRGFSPHPS